jgi:hypothetical protein
MPVIRQDIDHLAIPIKPASKDITKKAVDVPEASIKAEDKKIIIEGPLSAIYTKALDELYKNKKINAKTKLLPIEISTEANVAVYTIDDRSLVTHGSELTNFIYRNTNADKAIILQRSVDGSPIRGSIITLAKDANVPIYDSLETLLSKY